MGQVEFLRLGTKPAGALSNRSQSLKVAQDELSFTRPKPGQTTVLHFSVFWQVANPTETATDSLPELLSLKLLWKTLFGWQVKRWIFMPAISAKPTSTSQLGEVQSPSGLRRRGRPGSSGRAGARRSRSGARGLSAAAAGAGRAAAGEAEDAGRQGPGSHGVGSRAASS